MLPPAGPAAGVRRILVVKLRAIGDVLLSTVVTRNLREAYPEARIDFVTEPPSRGILDGNPYIDRIIIFRPGRENPLAFFWKLYRARYDLVFDLFCNPRSAQMTFATRAPVRVGYPFRGRAYAYNVRAVTRADRVHNAEFNLDAIRAAGIPTPFRVPVFAIPAEAQQWADSFLGERNPANPLIALNPSGTWETKRWGLDHFARLADLLHERHRADILLVWGPGEQSDALAIRSRMISPAIVPPATTLKELGALLRRCDFMISNDSGPMHIAAAVGTSVLGIFGPTNPRLQGPLNEKSAWVRNEGLDCLSCNLTACPIGNVCMTRLEVDTVLKAFENMRHAGAT